MVTRYLKKPGKKLKPTPGIKYSIILEVWSFCLSKVWINIALAVITKRKGTKKVTKRTEK